jgi:SAM-dependent methyltransferase
MDRSLAVLRPPARPAGPVLAGEAEALPFADSSLGTVLAADLVHHLSSEQLERVLREIVRTLRPGGRLVAWWYEHSTDPSPDAPRHPRLYDDVASVALGAGLVVSRLALSSAVEDSPTVGLVGQPSSTL